jgi:hypothetical protein
MKNLLDDIALNYKNVPYHNFTHGFNLMHLIYCFYQKSQAMKVFNNIEIFAILIGSLAHDIGHKGVGNIYY